MMRCQTSKESSVDYTDATLNESYITTSTLWFYDERPDIVSSEEEWI